MAAELHDGDTWAKCENRGKRFVLRSWVEGADRNSCFTCRVFKQVEEDLKSKHKNA
jgi:hypothetical protein